MIKIDQRLGKPSATVVLDLSGIVMILLHDTDRYFKIEKTADELSPRLGVDIRKSILL